MRNKATFSWIYVLAGLAFCTVPRLTTCSVFAHAGYMACWETANIVTITGLALILIGIANRFVKKSSLKATTHGSAMVASYMTALIPALLATGCPSQQMLCHAVGFPTIYAIAIATGLAAAAGLCISFVEIYEKKTAMLRVE